MSEDEIICNNCGKPNKKDSKYCIDCGALIAVPTQEYTPDTGKISDITSITPPKKLKKKITFPYKILIFFGIVAFVNFILSYIVMIGFALTPDSYFPIFGGMFLLSMLMVGIFWGAYSIGGADAIEGIGYCGAFAVAIILVGIAIPVWIIFALAPIVGAIFTAIGQAISNAINSFFTALFENIEIPGFEPFLFIGLFMVLSIIIIYKYHLNAKKN
ncbi:MAG: zinc-ribbon domain-containing protein [Promethearchaeota archaeon]